MTVNSLLEKLRSENDLTKDDIKFLIQALREKKLTDDQIENLIILWRCKKESVKELLNLQAELFALSPQEDIFAFDDTIDVCGTGGDKSNTFNISTLSAIVASACGAKVIKHSGRSTTSITGSVDLLDSVGISMNADKNKKEKVFKATNLMFVASDVFRDTFSDVKRVCKKIDLPGFTNLLGPIASPYKTKYQLLGVSNLSWGDLLAATMLERNIERAIIACSEIDSGIYLDEITFCGVNYLWIIEDRNIQKVVLKPENIGEKNIKLEEIIIKNKAESKDVFEKVLQGKASEGKIKTVAINAGAALFISNKAKTIKEGYEIALNSIRKEIVWEHFQNFLKHIT